jgi:hypothetical protein
MAPTQTITEFASMPTFDLGPIDMDGEVNFMTATGVKFTMSAPTVGGYWFANVADFIAMSNSRFTGTQTFTLNWENATGQTLASCMSLVGTFEPGEAKFITENGSVSAVNGSALMAEITGVKFIISGPRNPIIVRSMGVSFSCFAPGTRIATTEGPRVVESLRKGDDVLTADGRATPIVWVGRQTVDARTLHPDHVNPIRITAGALGHGLPERDLRLSADHAVEIDGVLYNAGTLVNGTTIYQEQDVLPEGFTYYHIETEAHELLLAEGVAAESFIDYAGRDRFDNGDELRDPIPEMNLPRVCASRLVPSHIRTRLAPAIAAEWRSEWQFSEKLTDKTHPCDPASCPR